MKNFIITLLIVTCNCAVFGQATVAMDWTKTDCTSGNTYNLFDILNTNKVVVQEYVMMDCSPCITAGNVLMDILNDYGITNPNEIVAYQTAFDNSTDCATMQDWADVNGFNASTLFIMGEDEINYYGAMGMPTILIFGSGIEHKVYYYHLGSISSAVNQNEFKAALDVALAETANPTAITENRMNDLSISPNPVYDFLYLDAADQLYQYSITDITGKLLISDNIISNNTIATNSLQPGVYFLVATNTSGAAFSNIFIKQ